MSLVTTEPAPIITLLPILTGKIVELEPILTRSPTIATYGPLRVPAMERMGWIYL